MTFFSVSVTVLVSSIVPSGNTSGWTLFLLDDDGGIHEIELTMEPKDLPQHITVDISKLDTLDAQIKVSDLKFPASAELSIDANEVVAMISVAQDEPEEPAAAPDLSAIETSVERGKKEEDAPEGDAAAE